MQIISIILTLYPVTTSCTIRFDKVPLITLTFYLLQSLLINILDPQSARSSLINDRIKINSNWNARVKQRHTPIVDINEQRMTYSLYSLIRQGNLTLHLAHSHNKKLESKCLPYFNFVNTSATWLSTSQASGPTRCCCGLRSRLVDSRREMHFFSQRNLGRSDVKIFIHKSSSAHTIFSLMNSEPVTHVDLF